MRMIREGRTIMVQFPNNEGRGIEKLALKGKIGRRSKLNGFYWHTWGPGVKCLCELWMGTLWRRCVGFVIVRDSGDWKLTSWHLMKGDFIWCYSKDRPYWCIKEIILKLRLILNPGLWVGIMQVNTIHVSKLIPFELKCHRRIHSATCQSKFEHACFLGRRKPEMRLRGELIQGGSYFSDVWFERTATLKAIDVGAD